MSHASPRARLAPLALFSLFALVALLAAASPALAGYGQLGDPLAGPGTGAGQLSLPSLLAARDDPSAAGGAVRDVFASDIIDIDNETNSRFRVQRFVGTAQLLGLKVSSR